MRFQGPRGTAALAFSPDGRLLASAGADKAILLWKVPDGESAQWRAEDTTGWWADLASKDGKRAHQTMARFAGAAEQAVPFLQQRLRMQLKPVDGRRIAQLVQDLDADSFARREKASRELAEMGESATARLNKALEGEPSAEMRRRAQKRSYIFGNCGPSNSSLGSFATTPLTAR